MGTRARTLALRNPVWETLFPTTSRGNTVGNSLFTGNHLHSRVSVKLSGKQWETMVNEYIRCGWSFRIKTSKGRQYITRRRGQEERGMGRFTEELWSVIERLKNELLETVNHAPGKVAANTDTPSESEHNESEVLPKGLSRREFLVKRIEDSITVHRGGLKMGGCMHNMNSYCTYWLWSSRPPFFDHVDECFGSDQYARKDIQVGDKIEKKWVFRASPWYCGYCSSFKKK